VVDSQGNVHVPTSTAASEVYAGRKSHVVLKEAAIGSPRIPAEDSPAWIFKVGALAALVQAPDPPGSELRLISDVVRRSPSIATAISTTSAMTSA